MANNQEVFTGLGPLLGGEVTESSGNWLPTLPPWGWGVVAITGLLLVWMVVRWVVPLVRLYAVVLLTSQGFITRVSSHVDGDTVRVKGRRLDGETIPVRLIGIDTPESRRSPHKDIAPFGKEAAAYTAQRLAVGQRVLLVFDSQSHDKFGRLLAYLYLPGGEFFNATLVREGYAWTSRHPPNLKHAATFDQLQQYAQSQQRPLWRVYSAPGVLLRTRGHQRPTKTQPSVSGRQSRATKR